jgi:hypothetical protein
VESNADGCRPGERNSSCGFAARQRLCGHIDAVFDGDGVLAHQSFGTRALPALQRFHDGVMLAVRVMEHVVHLLELALVEREGLRAGERDAAVALECFGEIGLPAS